MIEGTAVWMWSHWRPLVCMLKKNQHFDENFCEKTFKLGVFGPIWTFFHQIFIKWVCIEISRRRFVIPIGIVLVVDVSIRTIKRQCFPSPLHKLKRILRANKGVVPDNINFSGRSYEFREVPDNVLAQREEIKIRNDTIKRQSLALHRNEIIAIARLSRSIRGMNSPASAASHDVSPLQLHHAGSARRLGWTYKFLSILT